MNLVSQRIDESHLSRLLALNNVHAQELSLLDAASFRALVGDAFFARRIGEDAMILAFDQDAPYESPNFLWFKVRYAHFVYIDRVVVSDASRGRGLARALYGELIDAAAASGHERLVCEVNIYPPNPASDDFHARLGFTEIGRATIHGGAKLVRYLELRLRG